MVLQQAWSSLLVTAARSGAFHSLYPAQRSWKPLSLKKSVNSAKYCWLPSVARVENGSLAGSVLTLDKAVRYAILNLGQAAPAAVSMASVNVVNSLNLTEKIGAVLPGFEANFNLIDNNYDLVDTYIDGVMINQRSS